MNEKMELSLSERALEEIAQHAQETFPEECCGVIFNDGAADRVHRLKNIQNQLHALDPQTYPRTATIAYAMDYKELELVIDEAKRNGARLKAFYHSHPNHDRSEEHTSELQSLRHLVCRLLLEKKKE